MGSQQILLATVQSILQGNMNPSTTPAYPSDALSGAGKPTVHTIIERYDNAILVRRWLGCWIDMLGCFACLIIPQLILGTPLYQKTVGLWLLLMPAYFIVPEWRWGRTLGKLLTATVVVNQFGAPPSIGQVLIRTVFRLFEVNPLIAGGIPAGIAVAVSKRKQRLGDMAANTYVMYSKDLAKLRSDGASV
jgi:uncharacterized RDD family membrane protein YckC